jgi:hypothetical protein
MLNKYAKQICEPNMRNRYTKKDTRQKYEKYEIWKSCFDILA